VHLYLCEEEFDVHSRCYNFVHYSRGASRARELIDSGNEPRVTQFGGLGDRERKDIKDPGPASLPTTEDLKWVRRLRSLTKDIRLRIRHRRNSSFIELRVIRHQTVLQLYTACTTKDRSYVECQRPTSRARLTCGQVLRSGFFSPPNHLSADEIASD
jgi:hypothetical protein